MVKPTKPNTGKDFPVKDQAAVTAPAVAETPPSNIYNSRRYEEFVKSYKQFGKQSAENIIKQAQIVVQAKEELLHWDFRKFLNEVGLVEDGPTHKKVRVIGENYHRFEPFLDRLPNSWTTLYKLASLAKKNPSDFKRVTESARFCSSTTADDITAIVGKTQTKKKETPWKIDPSSLGEKRKVEFYLRLASLRDEFSFKLIVPEAVVAVANSEPAAISTSVPIGTEAAKVLSINPAAKEG